MYDLIVIGGGVNGTGIARDAAQRGFRTLLIEKRDVAAGSSGANSGMIHGGVRYLRYDRSVTEMACIDSGYIQRIAPHLLFRIPFLFPIHAKDPQHPGLVERGLRYGVQVYLGMYDDFQPHKRGMQSAALTAEEAYRLEPSMARDLIGAVSFDEWGIDPFRLCAGNMVSARSHGCDVLTYARVIGFSRGEQGRVTGVEVRDEHTGKTSLHRGKVIFNASGPWSPRVAALAGVQVKIRPGKGVHLTLDRRVSNYGVVCRTTDGREIFVMPHEQTSIIGTTDDDYYGDPDDLRVTEDEVKYLWEAACRSVPSVAEARILRAWAGVRPTLYEYGKTEDALSREHEVYDHERQGAAGLLTMVGGKLASYRIMSEEAVDKVERVLRVEHRACRTHLEALPGGDRFPDVEALAKEHGIPEPTVARIAYRHGRIAEEICELASRDRSLAVEVCRCEQVIAAELVYSIRNEEGRRLLDLRRRNRLGMGPCQGEGCAAHAAAILARERGLSVSEHRRELHDLLHVRWKGKRPALDGDALALEELTRGAFLTTGALGAEPMAPALPRLSAAGTEAAPMSAPEGPPSAAAHEAAAREAAAEELRAAAVARQPSGAGPEAAAADAEQLPAAALTGEVA